MVSKAGAGHLACQQHMSQGGQHCSRTLRSSSDEEDEVVLHGGAGTPHLDYCQRRTHVGAYTSPKGPQPVDEPMTEQVHPQGRREC